MSCRRQRSTQYTIDAIWEAGETPLLTRPVGRALKEVYALGWTSLTGWWLWQVLGQEEGLYFCNDHMGSIQHEVRDSLRYSTLICHEKRRPRQYGGMEGLVQRKMSADALQHFTTEEELRAARQILVGAVWTKAQKIVSITKKQASKAIEKRFRLKKPEKKMFQQLKKGFGN